MVAQELEGDSLGQRHKDYNAKLQELITTQASPDTKLSDTDINSLLKIDIASHNKNIEYILDVLKCDDMLYVSRALSRSTWLITDQKYEHILNPEYLQLNLLPNMTTKAGNKLKKFIRHNIKDEARAERFCLNEKNPSDAIKWLPHCSVQFVETQITDFMKSSKKDIKPRLFHRLCEKSVTIFKVMLKNIYSYQRYQYLNVVRFLLNANTVSYLDILEEDNDYFGYGVKLNDKATAIIMKHTPNRILDKIDKYISIIHIPTFAQCLTPDQIKSFIYAQTKKDLTSYDLRDIRNLFQFDKMKLFIERLPKDEQFDFVKNICLRKEIEGLDNEILPCDTETVRVMKLCCTINNNPYVWYQFAPFEVAFAEITKLYLLSEDNYERRNMICTLIKCANGNWQHIKEVVAFYKKNTKDDSNGKGYIANIILKQTRISKYDEKSWNILNELILSANIYDESNIISNLDPQFLHLILIYYVLNDQKTPEEIEKAFSFTTLKTYRTSMNQEQQNKIFEYLYKFLLSKIKDSITDEKILTEHIQSLGNVLRLINDWEKSFLDFPCILNKIRDVIKIKKENSWKTSLSSLYNINKSWRKHMFEESVDLYPSEEVCLNALKHDPQLLMRHADQVDALRTNDSVCLRRLVSKLRLYWPRTLAQQWIDIYMANLDKTNGQTVAVQSLCTMLPQKPFLDMVEKYKPINAKIDWKQIEENILNIQRLLAKNMHISRPQPNPDVILGYAKGDYLQFALPSLLAIFYNLKPALNKQYIPKLLDAPVSVQKHGIRLAFEKLHREELRKIFLDCWKASKNVSIRAMIFKYTFKLLCSEKDDASAVSLWELLELFMDNLTFTEDPDTYNILSEVDKVPLNVRAKFLIKSYEFLQQLIPKVDESKRSAYQWFCANLAQHSREVMETINQDFVLKIIHEFIESDFFKRESKFVRSVNYSDGIICVMSAYLLCTTNEIDQILRYEQVVVPLMKRAFEMWNEKRDDRFFIRQHFQHLLTRLSIDLNEYSTKNKKVIPLKMFSLIQNELEKSLKVSENYMMLTKWKLTVTLARLAEKYSSSGESWYDECGQEFGKSCLQYLKTDVTTHFPCIYVLFSRCIRDVMDNNNASDPMKQQFYKSILSDQDFIQGYLTVIEISANQRNDDKYKNIHNQISCHASVEVKMHYYNRIAQPKV